MDPHKQAILAGQFRHVLSLAAGYLVAKGKLSEADAAALCGIALAVVPMAWSWWHKRGPAAPAAPVRPPDT